MLNREEVDTKMDERGFKASGYTGDGSVVYYGTNPETICIRVNPMLSVRVYMKTGEFEVVYMVKGSINILTTCKCGSLLNDAHFEKVIGRLKEQAICLEKYL